MRKILAIAAVLGLAACGGGGGGTPQAPAQPATTPSSSPQAGWVTPEFTLVIPASTGSSTARAPKYINGTATLSVKITLISTNGTPTTVAQPSVPTNVNGTSGKPCNPSCTVSGPPSPPGTDRYSVTTYDAVNGTGNALSTATKDFTIVSGSANTGMSISLFGVVSSLAISGVPGSLNAGTTPADTTLTVTAKDAAAGTITGTYGDNSTGAGYIGNLALNGTPVTVTINETDANGATLVAAGGATQNSSTSVSLLSSSASVKLHYGGLAENQKTVTVAATGASNVTATFQPVLQAITPSSGTQIDLYVDSTSGGTGSSGTQNFTEAGFTGAPYNQTFSSTFNPTSGFVTPCSQIATIAQGTGSNGGKFTATAPTAATPPAAGKCDLVVNDNLTQGGHTSTATTVVTYTTWSPGINARYRRH